MNKRKRMPVGKLPALLLGTEVGQCEDCELRPGASRGAPSWCCGRSCCNGQEDWLVTCAQGKKSQYRWRCSSIEVFHGQDRGGWGSGAGG